MNRSHRFGFRLFSLLAALATLLGLFAPAGAARPASAQAPPRPPMAFNPITIATTDATAGLYSVEWLKSAGDWVAYATGTLGCGHCNTYLTGLHLVNVLNGRRIDINGARWNYSYSSGGETRGVKRTSVLFDPPYLIWEQPGAPAPQGYTYAPGDFDCTLCLYNVETGQGGTVPELQMLSASPPADPFALNSVTPLDLAYNGQVLAVSAGAGGDHFWIVNLLQGGTQQIPVPVTASRVSEAVLLNDGYFAWIDHDPNGPLGGRLMAYVEHQPGAIQVDAQAERLQHIWSTLYWQGVEGLQYYDTTFPPPAHFPTIPGVPYNYAVDIGYRSDLGGGVGSTLAWLAPAPSSETKTTLTVQGSVGTSTYFQVTLDGLVSNIPHSSLSIGGDKVAFVTYQGTSGPPQFSVQVAWLLNRDPAFQQVWEKADGPVAAGTTSRTWLWGPQPFYRGMEAYANPVTSGRRMVEYYDKSRMEVNNPGYLGLDADPYYVTNGLLVAEMIGNEMAVGETQVITARVPAAIPVAGDPRKDNPLTPGYPALAGVASLHGEHQTAARLGQPVDQTLDVNGIVGTQPTAGAPLASYAAFAPQTGHNIPDVFWPYLQGMAATYGFDWAFVTGYPITEAYWTQMRVSGKDYPVLIQAYQRRVLTYAPGFAPEWRIQQGNVGQHYFEWRYRLNGP